MSGDKLLCTRAGITKKNAFYLNPKIKKRNRIGIKYLLGKFQ